MTLYNRKAIFNQSAGSWSHIPPFEFNAVERELIEAQRAKIPFGPQITLYEHFWGWDIELECLGIFDDAASGLIAADALRSAFVDGAGDSIIFDLQLWQDTSGLIDRVYRDCRRIGEVVFQRKDNSWSAWTARVLIRSNDPVRYADATNSSNAPEGPYEDYLLGGSEGVSTTLNITINSNSGLRLFWPGAVDEATSVGNEDRLQRSQLVHLGATFKGLTLQAQGGKYATGTTTVRISNTDHQSDGDYIEATIGAGEELGSRVAGTVPVSASGYLYAYIVGAGGHNSLTAIID